MLEVSERLSEEIVKIKADAISGPTALGGHRKNWRQNIVNLAKT